MKYTLDNVCSRCVGELMRSPASVGRVTIRNGITADQQTAWMNDLNHTRTVASITSAMLAAFNYETTLEINNYVATPALVTFHGDKVCDIHLVALWDHERTIRWPRGR